MGKNKKDRHKIGQCKVCNEYAELYDGLCSKHYEELQKRKNKKYKSKKKPIEKEKTTIDIEGYIPPSNFGFTLEQIESRVLANCNTNRLKEHRQCNYCHMIFDCKFYLYHTKKTLCEYLDNNSAKV